PSRPAAAPPAALLPIWAQGFAAARAVPPLPNFVLHWGRLGTNFGKRNGHWQVYDSRAAYRFDFPERARGQRGGNFQSAAPAEPALVGGLELPQQVVTALDGGIDCRLGGLAPRQHVLQLVLDHVADQQERPEAQPARVVGRRVKGELLDRNVGPGVAVIEAL